MQLVKTHGSRNEIFVVPATEFASDADASDFARCVCDRAGWTGGGDGVYFYDAGVSLPQARFANPDGSMAEFCGNGMRGLGRHIMELRGTQVEVISSGGRSYTVRRGAAGPVSQVVVEMPPVAFGETPPAPFGGFIAVNVPNPHVVAVRESYDESELAALGERAAQVFGDGANVSFLVQLAPDEIFVRTFERGAGLTPACGSGVVAARAVYSRVTGADPAKPVLIRNVGGVANSYFQVRDGQWLPYLEGNATIVYRAEADTDGTAQAAPDYATDELHAYEALADQNTTALRTAGIF